MKPMTKDTEPNTSPKLEDLPTMGESSLLFNSQEDLDAVAAQKALQTSTETLYGTPDNPGTQCVASPTNVEGVTPGRIVAYYPKDHETYGNTGVLRAPGAQKFLPAVITCCWSAPGTSQVPCVNLSIHTADGALQVPRTSVNYSHVPTKGHWSWIPKA